MSMYKYCLSLCLMFAGITSCKTYYHLAGTQATTQQINAEPDSVVLSLVKPYKEVLDAKMNEVLASCPATMQKEKPESTLTNWVADALDHQAAKIFTEPIAFTFQNFGGIRINTLGKGAVTLGKIYEIMPFDNAFVLVKLSGKEVLKLLEYIAENDGLPVSSSVSMVIFNKKIVEVTIHNQQIKTSETYYVGMTDYLANGGDNLNFLKSLPRIEKNVLVRDMLISEAKDKEIIQSSLDHRISIKK